MHPKQDTWTTRRLLSWMTEAFTKKGLEAPRRHAEWLLAHVLKCDRLKLFTDPDRPASEAERGALRELVGRALKDEPVQYLIGEWPFFGLSFELDKRVLIPREATATIVEHVLQHARVEPGFGGKSGEGVVIADVCTGSGCIAIALLKHLPGARAVASDISPGALEVAAKNAQRHGVADRLDLVEGDLLAPIREHPATRGRGTVHYLVSNPPYIPDDEWAAVEPTVKNYEPEWALRGGPDGLRFVLPLIEGGPELLRPGGLMLVEVASSRAGAALELMKSAEGMDQARIVEDIEGLPRVVAARRGAAG